MSFEAFRRKMATRESNDRYYSTRGSMLGKYQFSPLRLIDLKMKTKVGSDIEWVEDWTDELFLANRGNIQEKLFVKHVLDHCQRLDRAKYRDLRERYHLAGLIAVAHLIGFSGMVSWSRSSSAQKLSNPKFKDGLKTPASDYYDEFKGYLLFDTCEHKRKILGKERS